LSSPSGNTPAQRQIGISSGKRQANPDNGFAPYNYFSMKKILETAPKKASTSQEVSEAHPYAATDPIPVPEARESDSDTTWALWEDSIAPDNKDLDPAFASTVPAELPTQPAALRPRLQD
jgi:hypothetical protein